MSAVNTMDDPLDIVIDALRDAGCKPKKGAGEQWYARCPVHERTGKHNPSLAVGRATRNEAAGITCHAGCDTREIIRTLGLNWNDLFKPNGDHTTPTLVNRPRRIIATYPYHDEAGTLLYEAVRYDPKDFRPRRPTDTGSWIYNLADTRRVLYRLPQLVEAVQNGRMVVLVEGEKDADRLNDLGLAATCNLGGAKKWRDEYNQHLAGAHIAILPDNDDAGREHAHQIAASTQDTAATIRIVALPELPPKGDVSDWLDAGNTAARLKELILAAPFWDPNTTPPDATEPEEQHVDDSPWHPSDLTDIVAGTYEPPQPTALYRNDNTALLYPGSTNAIFGESESGKSWIALHATAQLLNAGRAVMYIDFEATAPVIIRRLQQLGVPNQAILDHLAYMNPDTPLDDTGTQAVNDTYHRLQPDLVVLDGVTGAMGIHGWDPLNNADAEKFDRKLPRPLAALGAAVLLVDHVPKSKDADSKYAMGAQHKRAAISGAAYRIDVISTLAPGKVGKLKLTISKDRHGAVRATNATTAGVFVLDSTDPDSPQARLDAPQATEAGKPFRPTHLMEKVSRLLEVSGEPLTKNAIAAGVTGKKEYVLVAVDWLVREGWVDVEVVRSSHLHRSVKPYRDEEST